MEKVLQACPWGFYLFMVMPLNYARGRVVEVIKTNMSKAHRLKFTFLYKVYRDNKELGEMTNEENKLMQKKTNNGESVNCIDCGGCNICTVFIRSPKDNNITVPVNKSVDPCDYLYTILRCKDCGSIFLHPYYFEESFGVYNDERYFTGYFLNNIHTGGGPSLNSPSLSFYTKWRNKRKARLLLKLAGFFQQSNIRVIDIGCAKGELVQAFVDCGCDAYGVDVSEQVVLEAQKKA